MFLNQLHPQNKNRSIVLFPEQFNNIEENLDLEKTTRLLSIECQSLIGNFNLTAVHQISIL